MSTNEAVVTSCVPLSSVQLENLRQILSKIHKKDLSVVNKVDKNLLAGFTVKIADWFFDASWTNQLEDLKQKLIAK